MMPGVNEPNQITLKELVEPFTGVSGVPDVVIKGVASNSRLVKQGFLFFGLFGRQVHGIDYAIEAVKAGAVAIVYDTTDEYSKQRIELISKQVDVCWIGIDDLEYYTGEIASRFYGDPSAALNIIGVTGTDGKTSVTHLLCQAFEKTGRRVASIGTLGYGLSGELKEASHTTPDAITLQACLAEFRDRECDVVVMEVSSHALQQYRVNGCQFDIAVLTNLGSDHLDYHGNLENYAAAKARLFEQFELSGSVVNVDDSFGRQLLSRLGSEGLVRYSASASTPDQADVFLSHFERSRLGQKMTVETPLGSLNITSSLLGDFNRENTLACISSLIAFGFGHSELLVAVDRLQPIPGRMELIVNPNSQFAPVVVDFAHTEQALIACLEAARNYTSGKLWCVFGCGGDRDQSKRPLMGRAAEMLADLIVITDDNPRTETPSRIIQDICTGLHSPEKANVVHDRRAAIEFALARAESRDLVVIAGKGHEQVQIVGVERLPFSDRHRVLQTIGVEHD